ncbi:reverse transcriptase domain-containing protein, partial [Tanacetum coccineum]
TLQLRSEILNFRQFPTESVFEAWERFKSCLRKCPDHIILLHNQILTFYNGIMIIDQERLMVAVGVEVLGKQTGYTIQSVQHNPGPGHPNTFYYSDSNESDADEPSEMIEDQKLIHHLSGSPTPSSDPVVASLSPSLNPTEDSDSILEETDTLLPHHDSTSSEVGVLTIQAESSFSLNELSLFINYSTRARVKFYKLARARTRLFCCCSSSSLKLI